MALLSLTGRHLIPSFYLRRSAKIGMTVRAMPGKSHPCSSFKKKKLEKKTNVSFFFSKEKKVL